MTFDDRLRDSLTAAGQSLSTGEPPTADLVARAARRRNAKFIVAGGTGALVLLVAAVLVIRIPTKSDTKLTTASHASTSAAPPELSAGEPTGVVVVPGDTTTTRVGSDTTSIGTGATAGTAYSPPGSVVYPQPTTTIPRPGPTTTVTAPTTTGDVVITEADAGKTFTLHVGQRLIVNLNGAGWDYSEPDTDNASVLPRLSGSADPSTGNATATFKGHAGGQAHVSASKDAPCRKSNPPCMVPTYLFQVTVNIV